MSLRAQTLAEGHFLQRTGSDWFQTKEMPIMSSLKSKLKNKQLTIGSWLSLGNAAVCEMMVHAGFDWLVVDMEHTSTDFETMENLIRVTELSGCVPLVRVGANDPLLIKHALDAGAHGVIIPQVKTAAEARSAVDAAYYPPRGSRGVGLYRAQGYGLKFEEYLERSARETVVVVQIEHRDGVDNLDEILSVEGVDAMFVGPYDLSGSFGKPGQFDAPEVVASMATITKKTRDGKVSGGLHVVQPDHELLQRRIDEGYTFIAYGIDMMFLSSTLKAEGSFLKSVTDKA